MYLQPKEARVLTRRLVAAVDAALDDYDDGAPRSEVRLMCVSSWTAGFLAGLTGAVDIGPDMPAVGDE